MTAVSTKSLRPVIDLREFNADLTGASDAQPQVALAVAQAVSAGGGTIHHPGGTCLLVAGSLASSVGWHIAVTGDNVHFTAAPGAVYKTTQDRAPFLAYGAMRGADPSLWFGRRPQSTLAYPFTAAARGDTSLILGTAGDSTHFTAGDWVYIRTGQLDAGNSDQPDAEINQLVSSSAGVLGLRFALSKPYAQEYFAAGDVSTTLNGGVTLPTGTLTLTSTTGLRGSGWVKVGGQTVFYTAVSGSTITGCTGGTGTISSGAAVWQGQSATTTTPSSFPALMSVAPITDRLLHNVTWDGVTIDAQGLQNVGGKGGAAIRYGFAYDVQIRRCRITASTNTTVGTTTRHQRVIDNELTQTPTTPQNYYYAAADTGSGDVIYADNTCDSSQVGFIHLQEGTSAATCQGNRITNRGTFNTSANAISVRGRSYSTQILYNRIYHAAGNGPEIYVGPDCKGGGIIVGNTIAGNGASEIQVADGAQGWTIGINDLDFAATPRASFMNAGGQGHAPRQRLQGWINLNPASGTATGNTITLGVLPQDSYVEGVQIQVTTVFNSSGTDLVSVGRSGAAAAYSTNQDVSATGIFNPTLGTEVGYLNNSRVVIATYTPGVADATQGKALVTLWYSQAPRRI